MLSLSSVGAVTCNIKQQQEQQKHREKTFIISYEL